jgi:hypothetical protein
MKIRIGRLLITFLMLPGSASSEFYRYMDGSGMTRFTDDFSKVPLDQRSNVKAYSEQASPPAISPSPSTDSALETPGLEASETPAAGTEMAAKGTQPSETESLPTAEELKKTSAAFDAEYEELMRQKTALDQAQADLKNPKEIKAHNSQVLLFNARIEDFEKRRDALHQKVQAYNARSRSRAR